MAGSLALVLVRDNPSNIPLVLSLSKDAYSWEASFDRLTTNGLDFSFSN